MGYGWKAGVEATLGWDSSSSPVPSWRSSNVNHWSGSCIGFCAEVYIFVSPKIFLGVLKILSEGSVVAMEYIVSSY